MDVTKVYCRVKGCAHRKFAYEYNDHGQELYVCGLNTNFIGDDKQCRFYEKSKEENE